MSLLQLLESDNQEDTDHSDSPIKDDAAHVHHTGYIFQSPSRSYFHHLDSQNTGFNNLSQRFNEYEKDFLKYYSINQQLLVNAGYLHHQVQCAHVDIRKIVVGGEEQPKDDLVVVVEFRKYPFRVVKGGEVTRELIGSYSPLARDLFDYLYNHLRKLCVKFDKSIEEMAQVFMICCGKLDLMENYLKNEYNPKDIWRSGHDCALVRDRNTPVYSELFAEKGNCEIERRKQFLGLNQLNSYQR